MEPDRYQEWADAETVLDHEANPESFRWTNHAGYRAAGKCAMPDVSHDAACSAWEWDPNADFQPHREDGWEFTCDSKGCSDPATLHVENQTSRYFVCAHHAALIPDSRVTHHFEQNATVQAIRPGAPANQ